MKRLCLMIWVFGLILSWVGTVSAAGPAEGWIAFGSTQDGDWDIWAIRPDGTGLRQLIDTPGENSTPQWSPDSTKIVYPSNGEAGETVNQLWLYDWYSATNTKIYDAHDYEKQDLGTYYITGPTWSPDGSKIIFREDASYNNPHITVINADGTGRAIVPVESGYVDCPSWSPTGTAFVYIRRNAGPASNDLWIYDFTATDNILNGINHRLTASASSESTTKLTPDWAPSGDIVFAWGYNIAVIDPGESPNWTGPISSPSDPHVTFLTNDASYYSLIYGSPSWSPDLSQIVYNRYYAGKTYDLWTMDASGDNRYHLVLPGAQENPDWGNPQPSIPTEPPIADAGDDIVADANEEVILDGSNSSDPDDQIIKYTWKRLPDGLVIYSGKDSTCRTRALGRVEEVIELTVMDNFLTTATDTVKIISRTIQDLQDQIDNIELTPGPRGPQGEPGIAPEEVEAMQSQIEGLQQQNQKLQTLLDKITSWPRIRHWLRSWERGRR